MKQNSLGINLGTKKGICVQHQPNSTGHIYIDQSPHLCMLGRTNSPWYRHWNANLLVLPHLHAHDDARSADSSRYGNNRSINCIFRDHLEIHLCHRSREQDMDNIQTLPKRIGWGKDTQPSSADYQNQRFGSEESLWYSNRLPRLSSYPFPV